MTMCTGIFFPALRSQMLPVKALKGRNTIARGNAPGSGAAQPPRSPEGAKYPESGYLALTGLGEEYGGISTRGDAPGYGISPLQG